MMSRNIRNIGVNSWWKGYQVIVIDEVASEIPSTFLTVLLSRCKEMHVTLELCVFSHEDKQRLSIGLILRCEGNTRYAVQGKLDDLVQTLMPQFAENGFSVHLAEPGDTVHKSIDRFFGGDQSPYNAGLGFFPGDQLLGPQNYYIPGRYSPDRVKPISWEQLARILTRYPMSMMSIQLHNTVLSPAESRFIQENRHYFSSITDSPHAAEARMTYDLLDALDNQRLYFASIFCTGDELFTKDVAALMQTWLYSAYTIPPQELQKPDYLFFGDTMLKACTTQYGHMRECMRIFPDNADFLRLTHLFRPDHAERLFPLPQHTATISGLTVKRFVSAPVLIPQSCCYQDNARMICLGKQADTDIRLGMRLEDLRRHGFIVGKSGCGKTTFAMGLLYQLNQLGIPFLVVEPAKREYRSLLSVIKDLRIYTPGLSGVSPIQLNPFLPPQGVTLEEYLPALSTIFDAAISMDHPLDVILPQVIRICYNQHGWRTSSTRDSKGARPFGMSEFIKCYQSYIREQYANDVKTRENLESGGVVRLMQLISEHPVLFDTNNALDFDEILQYPTIIELDAIRNEQHRSLIMMTIMVQAQLCIQKRTVMDSGLRNVIMIDEAHLLLGNPAAKRESVLDSAPSCIRYLQDMVKILRSYGTGIFFGDQSPAKLTGDIMEHVNLKIMFQQDSPQNRAMLGTLTRMDNEMQEDLIDLPPGCGYVFLDAGLTKPVKFSSPDYKNQLSLREDVTNDQVARMMGAKIAPPFSQCAYCKGCADCCSIPLRTDAKFIADRILSSPAFCSLLRQPAQPGILSAPSQPDPSAAARQQEEKLRTYFSGRFSHDVDACLKEQGIDCHSRQQLMDCVTIQMIRSLLLDSDCLMTEESLLKLLDPVKADAGTAKVPTEAAGIRPLNKLHI